MDVHSLNALKEQTEQMSCYLRNVVLVVTILFLPGILLLCQTGPELNSLSSDSLIFTPSAKSSSLHQGWLGVLHNIVLLPCYLHEYLHGCEPDIFILHLKSLEQAVDDNISI